MFTLMCSGILIRRQVVRLPPPPNWRPGILIPLFTAISVSPPSRPLGSDEFRQSESQSLSGFTFKSVASKDRPPPPFYVPATPVVPPPSTEGPIPQTTRRRPAPPPSLQPEQPVPLPARSPWTERPRYRKFLSSLLMLLGPARVPNNPATLSSVCFFEYGQISS